MFSIVFFWLVGFLLVVLVLGFGGRGWVDWDIELVEGEEF